MTLNEILYIIAGIGILFYLAVCLRYEIQMLQQNSYRNRRYWKWLKKDLYRPERLAGLILLLVIYFFADKVYVVLAAAAILAAMGVWKKRRKYKKALVVTQRVQRLFTTCSLIWIAIVVPIIVTQGPGIMGGVVATMFLAAFPFLVVIIANTINIPVEKGINRRYIEEAKKILASMPDLRIIGITGSYGKTSTKNYLHRILSERFNVVMTPGSYNTTLGVVRTIREQLKPYHDIFIVEMGAKQRGDIREICDLVHPQIGILTSIGEQHLESFGSIENIQAAKFELIDALPREGIAVLNDDFEYIASRKVENVEHVIRYGSHHGADYRLGEATYSREGTNFSVIDKNGTAERLSTRIAGRHNLSNIMAGYIVAKELGMTGEQIGYAVRDIRQVEHRLDIRPAAGGVTVIDDAFNSNPLGAQMALEVLGGFTTGKRIVVTPGMIELGDKQHEYNRRFGEQIAASCDYAVIVGQYNRQAIAEGLEAAGFDRAKVFAAASLDEAAAHLRGILSPGDTVLYENDLPDTYK